jgi:hypothetical protein
MAMFMKTDIDETAAFFEREYRVPIPRCLPVLDIAQPSRG